MTLAEAIEILNHSSAESSHPELEHAMAICCETIPVLIADQRSTRRQLQRCQADRASIHLHLRKLSKERG
jgi:hypothetical protein